MGNSNGKITAPVSLHADVYPVLGLTKSGTFYDAGWVCGNAHGKINKWSKKKPIRYATPSALTDAQFKGTAADNNQGVYYGLQVATEAGKLSQLHDAAWNFLPPRPGTDWCRLTDFNGYDHNAVPTLNGSYQGDDPVYYNVERAFGVHIEYDYRGVNTTGVDIGDMLPATVSEDIGDYYPGILIGDYARSLYSTTANPSSNTGDPTVTPIRRNGTWDTGFYAVLDGLTGLKDGVTMKCTAFLIRQPYATGIFDFRQQWVNVAQTINAYNAFSIPGFIAQDIEFAFYQRYTVLRVYAVQKNNYAWPNANSGFSCLLDWPNGTPDETPATYRISITSPGVGYKDYRYNPPQLSLAPAFKWTEIGIIPNPGSSEPTNVRGNVSFVDSDGAIHSVSTFNLTLS